MEQYRTYIGVDKPAPDTVNPSLWRNAQLNMNYGLFKVADRIYQVRGYDLSNISYSGQHRLDCVRSPDFRRRHMLQWQK